MIKKGKKQGCKVQKVVRIVKARGVPDEVKVERSTETQSAQPNIRAKTRLPCQTTRITPEMPRLE